ncbi:unnamed protein product [Trichogramma brassicae]|uniref:Uncharacterized protein n=1 Tax=Trichogramma brassicae TaxID=86971 RepID=A0A6H5J6I9_9HYME|nr:unnamed protein product [Trichogramma brassicae]
MRACASETHSTSQLIKTYEFVASYCSPPRMKSSHCKFKTDERNYVVEVYKENSPEAKKEIRYISSFSPIEHIDRGDPPIPIVTDYIQHKRTSKAVAAHPFGANSTSTCTCAQKSIYGVEARNACAAVPLRALENSLDMCCKATSRYAHERERERQTLYDSQGFIRGLERQKPDIFDLVERHQSLRNTRARADLARKDARVYSLALVEQNYLKAGRAANTDQKSKIQDFGTPVYSKLVRITRASLHLILFSLARDTSLVGARTAERASWQQLLQTRKIFRAQRSSQTTTGISVKMNYPRWPGPPPLTLKQEARSGARNLGREMTEALAVEVHSLTGSEYRTRVCKCTRGHIRYVRVYRDHRRRVRLAWPTRTRSVRPMYFGTSSQIVFTFRILESSPALRPDRKAV